ncbi:hypothetical protein Brsp01_41820 [Brucella sp. NBRC 12950]|nr:hypothetical protein Brsp01_41820 [Brucella sp. NBRC 12950]
MFSDNECDTVKIIAISADVTKTYVNIFDDARMRNVVINGRRSDESFEIW